MIEALVSTAPESMVDGLTEAQAAEEHLVLVRFLGDELLRSSDRIIAENDSAYRKLAS